MCHLTAKASMNLYFEGALPWSAYHEAFITKSLYREAFTTKRQPNNLASLNGRKAFAWKARLENPKKNLHLNPHLKRMHKAFLITHLSSRIQFSFLINKFPQLLWNAPNICPDSTRTYQNNTKHSSFSEGFLRASGLFVGTFSLWDNMLFELLDGNFRVKTSEWTSEHFGSSGPSLGVRHFASGLCTRHRLFSEESSVN